MKAAMISAMLLVGANPNADTIQVLEMKQERPVPASEATITVSTLKPVQAITETIGEPRIFKATSGDVELSAQLGARQTWFEDIGSPIGDGRVFK